VSSQINMIEIPKWWTVRALSGQHHRAPQMMDSTCLLRSKRTVHHLGRYMILTWEDTHCLSSGELYDFYLRTQVVSIIWKALWFWPEKTRTVHHLGRYMILTWEDTYCPSSGTCLLR
jgi:hypothetical protein